MQIHMYNVNDRYTQKSPKGLFLLRVLVFEKRESVFISQTSTGLVRSWFMVNGLTSFLRYMEFQQAECQDICVNALNGLTSFLRNARLQQGNRAWEVSTP